GPACKRDDTQRQVTNRLFAPFSEPEAADQKAAFLASYRERVGVSPDASIINYDFHPFFLRREDKDFSDSIAVFAHSIINDPKRGMLSVKEEWYYSTLQIKPLLLRRQVISMDKKKFEEEVWASDTLLKSIQDK